MLRGNSFDERVLRWMDDHRVGLLDTVATKLVHLDSSPWFFVMLGLLSLAIVGYRRAWREGFALGAAFFSAGLISGSLKNHFERPRPAFPEALVQVSGYAMPSSHAAFMMAASVALLMVVRWTSRRTMVLAGTGLAIGLVFIGVAMVYIGAHWATDVFAGWALGLLVGGIVGLVLRQRSSLPGADRSS